MTQYIPSNFFFLLLVPSMKLEILFHGMILDFHKNLIQFTCYMLQETLVIYYQKPWLHVTGNPGYILLETLATYYLKYWLHVSRNPGYMLQETLATCYRIPWLHVTGNPSFML